MSGSEVRSSVRRGVACLLFAVAVSGCAGAVATPTGTPPGTSTLAPWTPAATSSPTPTPVPTPTPTATPTAAPTAAPPTPAPSADVPDWLKGDFDVLMGRDTGLTAAQDGGQLAGSEVDDFGFDLLRRVESGSANLCVSPTSIALALAMVRAGANGQTAAEMDKVLRGLGSPQEAGQVLALVQALRSRAIYVDDNGVPIVDETPGPTATPAVDLNLVNAAFVQKGMPVEESYLDALRTEFGAGAGVLDFQADPEAARVTINKWADVQTRGRIPNPLNPGDVTSATRIALANALYFKASWASQFDPTKTSGRGFTTAAGGSKTVATMAQTIRTTYGAGKDYRAVSLPYAGGFQMLIVVPTSMTSFVTSLSATRLSGIWSAMQPYDVNLTLPRFSIDNRIELGSILSAMGMPTVFSASADLSGITGAERLFLDRVVHQANIDVVEDGTTAAAVTIALGSTTGGQPVTPPKTTFHVDHPFLYFIEDMSSQAVLFEGVVNDPSAK